MAVEIVDYTISSKITELGNDCFKRTTFYKTGEIDSVTYYKGNKDYFHREEDLPAYTSYWMSGNILFEYYCKEGRYHRDEDKPAYFYYTDNGLENVEYFVNGKHLNKQDVERRIRLKKRKEILQSL